MPSKDNGFGIATGIDIAIRLLNYHNFYGTNVPIFYDSEQAGKPQTWCAFFMLLHI
jgi:hypothetical protein